MEPGEWAATPFWALLFPLGFVILYPIGLLLLHWERKAERERAEWLKKNGG